MNHPLTKPLIIALKIAVTVVMMIIVVRKLDFGEWWGTLKATQLGPLFGALTLGVSSSLVQAYRWKILLNIPEIKFHKYLHFIYLGYFFKIFLPGSLTGDIAKVYLFSKKYNEPISNSGMIFVFQFMGIFFQWMLGGIGLILYWNEFNLAKILDYLTFNWKGSIILLALMVVIALFLTIKFKSISSSQFMLKVKSVIQEPLLLFKLCLLTFVLQVFSFWYISQLLLSVGIEIPFFLLSVVLAIINTILIIPVSISGIGVAEYFSILIMSDILNFSRERVFSSNIIGYGFVIFFALAGGGWFLFRKIMEKSK